MKKPSYGREHRAAKTEKLKRMETKQCEITKETKSPLEAHHVVPRSFSGPDNHFNYQILTSAFHAYIHDLCNVKDSQQIGRRLHLSNYIKKYILDEEKVNMAKQTLEVLDRELMSEYISNLINKAAQNYKELIFLTILSNFETIRDLSIENYQLKAKLEAIDGSSFPQE